MTLVYAVILSTFFFRSLRNRKARISAERIAPSSTIKNIPGRPLYQKKSRKLMLSAEPSMMAVVSPTSVAAPCKLEETAIAMIKGTGLVLSFLQISRATGAIISTVATLSTNAEIIPANSESATAATITFGQQDKTRSASSSGILLSIKSATRPMVPAIMSSTFKLLISRPVPQISESGSIPVAINSTAEPSAI